MCIKCISSKKGIKSVAEGQLELETNHTRCFFEIREWDRGGGGKTKLQKSCQVNEMVMDQPGHVNDKGVRYPK